MNSQYLHIKALDPHDPWFDEEEGSEAIRSAALINSRNGEYIAFPISTAEVAEEVFITREVSIEGLRKGVEPISELPPKE